MKYVAKLRLLERGLLEAAIAVDDIQLLVRRSKSKSKAHQGKAEKEGESEDDDSGDDETRLPDETQQDFITRINLYVAIHFSRAPNNTRDSYKDGLVYQARKDIIQEFLKSVSLKKCQNGDCGWFVPPSSVNTKRLSSE